MLLTNTTTCIRCDEQRNSLWLNCAWQIRYAQWWRGQSALHRLLGRNIMGSGRPFWFWELSAEFPSQNNAALIFKTQSGAEEWCFAVGCDGTDSTATVPRGQAAGQLNRAFCGVRRWEGSVIVKITLVGFFPQDCSNGFQKVFVMKRVRPLISSSAHTSFHKGEGWNNSYLESG